MEMDFEIHMMRYVVTGRKDQRFAVSNPAEDDVFIRAKIS
jgi:hypothetical protein